MERIGIKDWKAFLSFMISSAALTILAFRYEDYTKVLNIVRQTHTAIILSLIYFFLLIDFMIVHWKTKSKLLKASQIYSGTIVITICLIIVISISILLNLEAFHGYRIVFSPEQCRINAALATVLLFSTIAFSVFQGLFGIIPPSLEKIDYTSYHLMRSYFLKNVNKRIFKEFEDAKDNNRQDMIRTYIDYLSNASVCIQENELFEKSKKTRQELKSIGENIEVLTKFFNSFVSQVEESRNCETINYGELVEWLSLKGNSVKVKSLINKYYELVAM